MTELMEMKSEQTVTNDNGSVASALDKDVTMATDTKLEEEDRLAWPLPPHIVESGSPESVTQEKQRYIKQASYRQQKCHVTKNVVALCITFLLTYTALFNTIELSRSLKQTSSVFKIIEQSLVFCSTMFGLLFFAPLAVIKFGCKVTMISGLVPFALYITGNVYVHWATVMPTAALLGIGIAFLWTAQGVYIARLADMISEVTGTSVVLVVNIIFGGFYLIYCLAYVWAALTSGFILQVSTSDLVDPPKGPCGALHSPTDTDNFTAPFYPEPGKLYTLRATCVLLSVLAIITLCVCLSKSERPKKLIIKPSSQTKPNVIEVKEEVIGEISSTKTSCRELLLFVTIFQLCRKQQCFLIPLTVYGGLQLSFFLWDFNQSYVNCSLGYWMVAMTTVCWGCFSALFSIIFGRIVSISGRIPLFTLAAVLQCGIIFGMFLWQPKSHQKAVLFVISALWGVSDSIWQCLLNGLYVTIFNDHGLEAAIANFHLWRTFGLVVAFIYGHFVGTYIKIFILLCTLIFGMVGYFAVEVPIYRRSRS